MKITVIDDYQDAFRRMPSFGKLAGHQIQIFNDTLKDPARLAERLLDAECVVLTQQRSWFRRLLIEAAWSYRFPARLSRELLLRQERQPRLIRDIAWKGQLRLCARYRRLARTGKPANIVTTAIARELSGFVWAIARQVAVTTD